VNAEGPAPPQVEDRLAVREEEAAFFVVLEGDPDDWLARFAKAGGFPAREWAENMVRVYNRRLALRYAGPPTAPGNSLTTHHPDLQRRHQGSSSG
jgi:hypothetical protein